MDLCRKNGVISYEDTEHGVKMLFGPPPVPKAKPTDPDPRAGKRAHYCNLLGRTNIADAELDLLPDGV